MLTVGDRALVLGTRCVVEVQKITRQDCIVKDADGRVFSINRTELAQLPQLHQDVSWWSVRLLPYYDPISELGLALADGDDLYRLSSAIPLAERRRIPIYPRGSFHTYATEGVIIDGAPWDSLEDWRGEWGKQFVCAKEDKPMNKPFSSAPTGQVYLTETGICTAPAPLPPLDYPCWECEKAEAEYACVYCDTPTCKDCTLQIDDGHVCLGCHEAALRREAEEKKGTANAD